MGILTVPPVAGLQYVRTVFLSSGTFTLPNSAFNKFDAVLVSGGGGGGRGGSSAGGVFGGTGVAAYFKDVFCTNGTELTVTVGSGGAGSTTLMTKGSNGTASTITGIAGNGASTSISSGIALGGEPSNFGMAISVSPQVAFSFGNAENRSNRAKGSARGFGFGMSSFASGAISAGYTSQTNIFGSTSVLSVYSCNNVGGNFVSGGTGGPIPLLGSLLHASVGTSGTAGTTPGGSSTANTFFAGCGGGGNYIYTGTAGLGGGGGAGGGSNISGTTAGSGGNGSVNSGGGGGAGGTNGPNRNNNGNGGSGGSGFVIVGYWG